MSGERLSCFLGLVLTFLLNSPVLSQSENISEHLLRVASERERIVQYAVLCKVNGALGDLSTFEKRWTAGNDAKVEIYYEFSRVEQHYITAINNLAKPQPAWTLIGSSGDIGLIGKSGERLKVLKLDSLRQSGFGGTDARHTKLRSFDPMAVGLVFCGDFYTGLSFEAQMGDFLNANPKIQSTVVEKGDLVTWTRGDTLIEFDSKRGYWPTRLDYQNQEITWEIKIGKYKDFYVPVHAVLTCNTSMSAPKHIPRRSNITTIEFEWQSVNESFGLGVDAEERLSKKFEIDYEKQ